MPYRTMSLEEFAKHVGMDARELRRLAEAGKLPGNKVGGQWRFNRAMVTEWLQQEMHTLDERRLVALERAMTEPSAPRAGDGGLVVSDLIGPGGIDLALPARTRASVLTELVKLAGRTGLLYDDKGLLAALQARESLCSTALPNGLAIPHPRQPTPYLTAEPLICVGRVSRGVGFGAPDGETTRLFFLICCHDDRHHLHVLARLMRVLDGDTIEQLLEVETPDGLRTTLAAKEANLVSKGK